MTIITAKRRAIAALRLTPLALAAMLLSNECRADWRVTPVVDLRETYSDNIANQADALARSGFVTEGGPSINVTGNSRRLKFTGSAEFHRYIYPADDIPNLRDSASRYQAALKSELIDELLFLDASAGRARQTVSAFGPVVSNSYSALNNTDVRSWSIVPSVRHRFGTTALVSAQFSRDSARSGLSNAFGNSMSTGTSLTAVSGPEFRELGWNLSYVRQELSSTTVESSSSQIATAGLQWMVRPHLALTSNVGYDNFEYSVLDQRTRGRSWLLGFKWAPSSRTTVTAAFGRRYFGKTGSILANHRTRHSTWNLSYSDAITSTRAQFLLPAAIDTASMLDKKFLALFPDPAERQQAIADYIAATGLPASLPNAINYLSNRYSRNKHLQINAILIGARSNLAFNVFKEERNAVSLQQADSALLPTQLGKLNDNVRQFGASASAYYKLSSRTRIDAMLYGARVRSMDTGLVNNIQQISLSLNRRFDIRTTGMLELRHSTGRAGQITQDKFHENALMATLSVRY